jgi:four helix bundle protein
MMANPLREKSYAFAIRIVRLAQFLQSEKKEKVLSTQLLRSGTAIGALIREGEYGQSKADFVSKMSIALKEANETDYWISILKDTGYLTEKAYKSMDKEIKELLAMLIATVKTAKRV